MAGPTVGNIEVRVDADTSRLKAQISAAGLEAGEAARKSIDKKLGDIGGQQLDKALGRVREKIQRSLAGIAVDIGIDDDRLKADLAALRAELRAQEIDLRLNPDLDQQDLAEVLSELRGALRNVDVLIETDVDRGELITTMSEISALIDTFDTDVELDLELSKESILEIKARLKEIEKAVEIRAKVKADDASIAAAEAKIKAKLQDITVSVETDVDDASLAKTQTKLKALSGKMGKESGGSFGDGFGLGFLGKRAQLIAGLVTFLSEPITLLIQSIAGVGAQLIGSLFQALGSAAGAATPLVFGLAAGLSAVLVGSQGFGKAFKAINTEFATAVEEGRKFNLQAEDIQKALKNLAPSARDTAVAFSEIVPWLHEIQQQVQQALFAGMGDQIRGATGLISNLGDALVIAAGQANTFGKDLIAALKTIDFKGLVGGLTPAMASLSDAISTVVKAIQPFIEAATPAATRLGEMLKLSAESFLRLVEAGDKSGGINKFLQDGLTALSTWWDLLKNVGSTLFTIFQAGAEGGTGLVRSLSDIVGKFNEWLKTEAGQAALQKFFDTANTVMHDLLPVVQGLGDAFKILTSDAAVDAFGQLTQAIGTLLPFVAEILAIISRSGIGSTFIQALALIAEALTPVLPVVSDLAVLIGTTLASVLQALAPLLPPLASAFGEIVKALSGGLSAILPLIVDLLSAMVEAVIPLVPLFVELATEGLKLLVDILKPLLPLLKPLIKAFGDSLAKALPDVVHAFEDLFDAIRPLIPDLVKFVDDFVKAVVPLLPKLVPLLLNMALQMAQIGIAVVPLVPPLLELLTLFLQLLPVLAPIAGAMFIVSQAFMNLLPIITGGLAVALEGVIDWFSHFPQTISDAITNSISLLQGVGSTVTQAIWQGIQTGWDAVLDFFRNLPQTLLDLVIAGLGLIVEIGKNIPGWILQGVAAEIQILLFWFIGLPLTLWQTVWDNKAKIIEIGDNIINWISDGIVETYHILEDWGKALPGAIFDLVSLGFDLVVKIGRAIIQWILDGIVADYHFLEDWVKELPGAIKDLATEGLGKLAELGKAIVGAIVDGIKASPGIIIDAIHDLIPDKIGPIELPSWLTGAEGGIFGSATPIIIGEAGREALIPLDRPLSQVDPSVRAMAALLRGENFPSASPSEGAAINKQVNVYQTITPTVADPEAVAASIINHAAAMAS